MERTKIKILGISGSIRKESSNIDLIHAIAEMFSDEANVILFQKIGGIPHFNPDLDNENPPNEVSEFRKQLQSVDGILICTPEYAMGVPGTLKNALDWTVSSMEFSRKPVALITASSSGIKAHQSLLETLKVIESDIPESSQLLISFVKTKIKGGKIIDAYTLELVKKVVQSLINTIRLKSAT